MTRDAKNLLKGLIHAQITEDGTVYIDYLRSEASTATGSGEERSTYRFPDHSSKTRSILAYLADKKLIQFNDALEEYCHVTHKGWFFRSETIKNTIQWIINSFIAPIVVAFATTFITLWLTGSLHN